MTGKKSSPPFAPAETISKNAYAVYPSFAMLAGMQLDLFTPLKDGPMSADALARSLGVKSVKLSPLLYALVAAGFLSVEGGFFSNSEEADRFFVRGRQEYMGGLCGLYNTLWQAALNTAESIRTGKPQAKLDWMNLPKEQLLKFFSGQYPGSLSAGRQLAKRIDFKGFKRLLDAGGGTGGLSIGICEKFPDLRATVADLPEVVSIAGDFIEKAGMTERIGRQAVDLTAGPPKGIYDVAVLRAFVQIMSPENAGRVLKNISGVMEPGGSLFIVGSILDNSRLFPPASVAFNIVFLNVYDEGRSYTEEEHRSWLLEAGFCDICVELDALGDGLGIVSARKA